MDILTENYKLYSGDCLEIMDILINRGVVVDAIICDPPYGVTSADWDKIINFTELWKKINKIVKPNGVVCLFGTQPFITRLISSNIDNYKYNWYWKKSKQNGFGHSKNKPMRIIEEIAVFSNGSIGHRNQLGDRRMEYNPQGIIPNGKRKITESNHSGITVGKNKDGSRSSRPNQVGIEYESYTNFPNDFLEYKSIFGKGTFHPTQKPTDLLEFLIKTYTNENELVLDFTMGSGSTGVACLNVSRRFIGIELDNNYFNIAINRIFEDYNK